MSVIEFVRSRQAETRFDFLDDDDGDGMVKTTFFRIEESDRFLSGDICDLFLCDMGNPAVAKVPRNPADNDLVQNEAAVLQALCPEGAWQEKFYRYLPELLHTDSYKGVAVNFFPYYGEYVTLAKVIEAYPGGIDFKDASWMYKRLLTALGFAHERGFIFGASIPDHVLVHPENHGCKIIDWSYAEKLQGGGTKHLRAISNRNRAYYPPEVFERKPVHPTLDIYMATKVMVALVGGDINSHRMPDTVPLELQNLLKTALVPDPKRRPQSAWGLHRTFEELMSHIVGPRVYRRFEMP
jgi:serine/threonine protein kinase